MLELEVAHLIAETGGETVSDTDSELGASIVYTVGGATARDLC